MALPDMRANLDAKEFWTEIQAVDPSGLDSRDTMEAMKNDMSEIYKNIDVERVL